MSNFQKNLKILADKYSQKYIATQTGFSQASINNYLTKSSEPSIQFLIALKNAFGVCLDDFLFADLNEVQQKNFERYCGNYIVCYYNNSSYKGEVHTNLENTLNYGVISITSEPNGDKGVVCYATFIKQKVEALKLLKRVNASHNTKDLVNLHKEYNNLFVGNFDYNEQSLFIDISNKDNNDHAFMIFNNPPSSMKYIGGVGTVNTVARGREHNPCVEFIIMSKNLIDKPDAEIYDCLKFNDYKLNLDFAMKELVELFKKLYKEKNDISSSLTENQKMAIVQNKLEYHFNNILEANIFRFAKVSNKEDDNVYKLIKEGIDV